MLTTSSRVSLGFLSGALSNLIFQSGLIAILYALHLVPNLLWSLAPVPPLGVPRSASMAFWAGLWGIAYAFVEPRLTSRLGWLGGGLLFGLAPLAVYWFVVLPLKGAGIGGGFHPGMFPLEIALHLVFGLGVAIIFRFGLALTGRRARKSPEALGG
jgi:hypothetical protein